MTLVDESKLVEIAENIPKVFNAGYEKGKAEGCTAKPEQEKTIEITQNGTTEALPDENKTLSKVTVNVNVTNTYYDMFWDAHLLPEKRGGAFAYAFYNWFDEMFYPKHDIVAKENCSCMFQYIKIADMVERLNECKVRLDTSGAKALSQAFANTQITHLPHISFSNATLINLAFYASKNLQLIDKITIKPSLSFSDAFNACEKLTTISEIEGEFGKNLNMSSCSKLDIETAKRILTHLFNYAGTENEFVHSISFHNNVWDLLDAEGETSPDGTTWKVYTDSKGWNY